LSVCQLRSPEPSARSSWPQPHGGHDRYPVWSIERQNDASRAAPDHSIGLRVAWPGRLRGSLEQGSFDKPQQFRHRSRESLLQSFKGMG
jgi:hypothetical protein